VQLIKPHLRFISGETSQSKQGSPIHLFTRSLLSELTYVPPQRSKRNRRQGRDYIKAGNEVLKKNGFRESVIKRVMLFSDSTVKLCLFLVSSL
jgi:hypothetical protein